MSSRAAFDQPDVIYRELVLGPVRLASREAHKRAIAHLAARGAHERRPYNSSLV